MYPASSVWASRHVPRDNCFCRQRHGHGLRAVAKRHGIPPGPFTCLLSCCSAGCLFSVLAEAELCAVPTIQTLLRGIVEIHLTYALSLQEERPPQEQDAVPQATNNDQVESQDEYGQFDLDWNDPTVLAALDSATGPAATGEPVAVPVPAMSMQYAYPSLIEVRWSHGATS
jgi:hypothetical protein